MHSQVAVTIRLAVRDLVTGRARGLIFAAFFLLLSATVALAVHDLGAFGLDRDAQDSVTAATDDWETVFTSGGSSLSRVFIADGNNPPQDTTYFRGGGSKDYNDISQWRYSSNDQAPDKDEITNAYAATYASSGDLTVYFGADRFANNGDSQIGFWLFQDSISTNPDGNFNGLHTFGDIFVVADFFHGGKDTTLAVYEWVGSGGSQDSLDLLTPHPNADCVSAASGDDACATVNDVTVPVPSAVPFWSYTPKSGSPQTFPPGSFFEGGVNVSRLLGDAPCFTSFLVETRSSHITDARLKDFALGQLGKLCDARISISPAADANQAGTNHALTILAEKKDSSTGFVYGPASGVAVSVAMDSGPGAFVGSNTCTTDASGKCTLLITSNATGLTSVSATADIPVNGHVLTRATDSANDNSGPARKRWVDARLALTPSQDANQIGDDHLITARLELDYGNGAGFVAAPDGESIAFDVTSGPGGLATPSCVTSGGNGACSVMLQSSATGLSSIEASWSGVIVTAEGTASAVADATAVKRWIDARLTLSPAQSADQAGADHVITAQLSFDYGNGSGFAAAPAGETITFSIVSGPGILTASTA